MATSFGIEAFDRRMRFLADELGDSINKLVRKTAVVIDQAVVFATPVDTGRARSNWRVALGIAPDGVIAPYSPGEGLGVGEAANAQRAISQALSVISQRREGQDVFIANNLPYIQPLNEGSSAQAPAGFVQMSVQLAAVEVANVRVFRAR